MRLTAGGDRINYPEDVGTPTVDMTLVKIFFNSVISTKGAKCVMLDVKDFYLNTPMDRYEYLNMPGYLDKALLRFKHETPKTKQNSPHPHVTPQYGRENTVCGRSRQLPPTRQRRNEIHSGGSGHLIILRQSS